LKTSKSGAKNPGLGPGSFQDYIDVYKNVYLFRKLSTSVKKYEFRISNVPHKNATKMLFLPFFENVQKVALKTPAWKPCKLSKFQYYINVYKFRKLSTIVLKS
jgi:hypothetical protein